MVKAKLSPEIGEKYTLVGISPEKRSFAGFGTIDFRTITLEQADALHRAGFKHLKLKQIPKPKSKGKQI